MRQSKFVKELRKQIRKNEKAGIWSVANAGTVLLISLVGEPVRSDGGS